MVYCDAVLRDEIHAYFLSGWEELVSGEVIELDPNREAMKKFSALFLKTLQDELAVAAI